MDFGGLDERFVCSDNSNSAHHLDPNPKWFGSGLCKPQETSHNQYDEWRDLKLPKITRDDFSKPMLLQHRSNSTSLHSDSHNMLSFSSPSTHQTLALPYYAPNTTGTTGYGCGGSMRGVMISGVRGPFTPSQWMELEHQALIYKYITVNAPIPSNLLIPIRKALDTAAFSAYPGTHATYGWGGFHLGFSNSSDPEPGRCRRTDGKKWRCSRDAVADQKYCERHMNRGRHRSRKPVEGQTGHSVSNGPTTTTAAAKASASAATSTIVSGSRMQPGTTPNPATFSHDNRSFLNKGNMGSEKFQDAKGRSMLSSSPIGLKENPLSVSVRTPSEFGFVCSDSLLNPLHKNDHEIQKSQNSLRQFMNDWPHSEKPQLSISIPMGSVSSNSSDLMPSTSSSPICESVNLSPLRMGLGVGGERSQQPIGWNPVSWESSMGGPLGEVLHHNSRNNSPSALNLMTDGWESSQQMSMSLSSPTGVLQKTTFGSVSNSSAGSSPRTDHNLFITSPLPLL